MRASPYTYRFFSETVRDNDALADMAIECDSDHYSYVTGSQRKRRDLALKAVEKASYVYRQLDEHFQTDPELIMTAIQNHGRIIEYMPHSIQTKDIALMAIAESPSCYRYIAPELMKNKTVIRAALQGDLHYNMDEIPPGVIENDPAFLEELLDTYGFKVYDGVKTQIRNAFIADEKMHLLLLRKLTDHTCYLLNHENYNNPDFMRKLAAIDGIDPDKSAFAYLSAQAAKAILEVRPEWKDNATIQQVLRHDEEQKQRERASKRETKGLRHHFNKAVGGHGFESDMNFALFSAKYSTKKMYKLKLNLKNFLDNSAISVKQPYLQNTQNIKAAIIAAAAQQPEELFDVLPDEFYQDAAFMGALVANPAIDQSHLKLHELSPEAAQAVVKARPDWTQNPVLQERLTPSTMVSAAPNHKPFAATKLIIPFQAACNDNDIMTPTVTTTMQPCGVVSKIII